MSVAEKLRRGVGSMFQLSRLFSRFYDGDLVYKKSVLPIMENTSCVRLHHENDGSYSAILDASGDYQHGWAIPEYLSEIMANQQFFRRIYPTKLFRRVCRQGNQAAH